MGWRTVVLAGLAAPACSFVLVQEPPATTPDPHTPLTCTESSTLPIADAVIGAIAGAAVFATTYHFVDDFNHDCGTTSCYTPWKPSLLAAFLVVSPFAISSAVGFSQTARCRDLLNARRP